MSQNLADCGLFNCYQGAQILIWKQSKEVAQEANIKINNKVTDSKITEVKSWVLFQILSMLVLLF